MPTPSVDQSLDVALQSTHFELGDWPDICWWQSFNDKTLNDLIEQALCYNPTLQQMQKRVEQAAASFIIVRSSLFPYLFFCAEDTYEYLSKNGLYRALNPKIPRSANVIDLSLGFQYEFDFWGKNANLATAASQRWVGEQLRAQQATLIVTTALAQAFFALKADLRRYELLTRRVTLRQALYDLQNKLLCHSLSTQLVPLEHNESWLEAKKELASLQSNIAQDRHLINILAGRGPETPLQTNASLPSLTKPFVIPQNLSLDLVARRPDLSAQIFEASSIAHEVGAAIADFFPDIDLTAFVGLESVIASRLFTVPSMTLGAKPALHLPIFTAGAIAANVRVQKARFDEAIFLYNEKLLQSVQQVSDLLWLATAIFEKLEEQHQIVVSATGRYNLSDLRRKKGLDTVLKTYLVEDELISKQLEEVSLIYSQYAAYIKLINALGGGYAQGCLPLESSP